MYRKLILLTTLGFLLITILTVCISCLSFDDHITSICFSGYPHSGTPEVDDLTEEVGFSVMGMGSARKDACLAWFESFGISSAYATTKCAKFDNTIDTNTFRLSFDRPFMLDSQTISPGTDLFQNPTFRQGIKLDYKKECLWISVIFRLPEELLANISFELGEYKASFHCQTSDGTSFDKERRVIFRD